MYVFMLKVLHNGWNIDLNLRLQKIKAVKKIHITLNDIQNKKKSYIENGFLCRRVTYSGHMVRLASF